MTEQDWPDDVLDAAAEHFHVPEMHDTILRQQAQIADNQAALGLIATAAISRLEEHPVKLAYLAGHDLADAAIDLPETGRLAPDNIEEGLEKMTRAKQLSWQERARLSQGAGRGII